jgi:hypothetical protein
MLLIFYLHQKSQLRVVLCTCNRLILCDSYRVILCDFRRVVICFCYV